MSSILSKAAARAVGNSSKNKATKASGIVAAEAEAAAAANAAAVNEGRKARNAEIGVKLAQAHLACGETLDEAAKEYARVVALSNHTKARVIYECAKGLAPMSSEEYDSEVKPQVVAALAAACGETIKHVKVTVPASQIKVAFLAFTHGIARDEETGEELDSDDVDAQLDAITNFQDFVNEHARPFLADKDTGMNAKKSGAKKKAKPAKQDERKIAALLLAGDASVKKDVRTRRMELLLNACTPGNWKLLEAKLVEIEKLGAK